MLTRHVRVCSRSRPALGTARSCISTALKASKAKPSWLETKGRTRSFLFDEDNPVTNKEAHKLHKVHLTDWHARDDPELMQVLESHDVRVWQSNPYLSMLASPIRKCMWSDKVMPRDFLLPIKAAVFNPESRNVSSKDKTSTASAFRDSRVSIFPRGLLHPAFTSTGDSIGKKDNRGYVVCKKSAMHDFSLKGAWKRLDKNALPNPYLVYQVDSQLRERVVQELKLLVTAGGEEVLPSTTQKDTLHGTTSKALFKRLPAAVVLSIRETFSLKQDILRKELHNSTVSEDEGEKRTFDPPAALFEFTASTRSMNESLVPEGSFSTLITYEPSILEGYRLRHLPRHRIPVYSIPRLFELDFDAPKQVDHNADLTEAANKRKKQQIKKDSDIPLWSDLNHKQDIGTSRNKRDVQIFNGEIAACEKRAEEFRECLMMLLAPGMKEQDLVGRVIAVPSMSIRVLPLLKALWRYRMWLGEGWSGDGFGVLEATGRKKAA
ncbi:hypothetical protein P389DRAFT_178816 [Cystobasidium minutum MCA 4210]|uniref:uncharacterized protein n=1 Tax=Cystobasidium minutum MCA 4210 TaxID=1397322 RepID=UPI0034CDF2AE|eukprot:jgi/Rhomi1/178816/fgenesh1_pg.3_\